MPSLRDGSVANCPNTLQLGFPRGQTPGGAEQRCTRRQDRCGQHGCMAWRRHTGTSLWRERSNGALPWGHWSPSGTHCHRALLVSTLRSPKTRVCCLPLQLAVVSPRHSRLLVGVQSSLEVLLLGPVPGASSGQPLGCIPPLRTEATEHRFAPIPESSGLAAPGPHPARWQALLGAEALPARRRKRDSGFQHAGMPGGAVASFLLPAARFLPPSLPPATAPALLETLSAAQSSQPGHQHCPGGKGLVRATASLSPFPSGLRCCWHKGLVFFP